MRLKIGGCAYTILFMLLFMFIPVGCSIMFSGGAPIPGKYGGGRVGGSEPDIGLGMLFIFIGIVSWIVVINFGGGDSNSNDD